MKIFVIGGKGTIGKRIVKHFAEDHEIVVGGRNNADVTVDIADSESILTAFKKVGSFDALICAAGEAKWANFRALSEDDYYIGLKSKLMGQVNVVRLAKNFISKKGSITLTTGILADDPVEQTTSAAMVNGAIHSFVQAVALEIEDGVRVNVVSSGLVEDAVDKYQDYFPGHNPIPMDKMLNAYVRSVMGKRNGEVIRVYD